MDINNLLIYSVEDISLYTAGGEKLLFKLNELQSAEFANGQETTFATGKGGARIASLDRSKTSQITCANGYIVSGALAAQTGAKLDVADHVVPWEETIAVKDGKAVLQAAAVGTAGAEIPYIYPLCKDGTPDTEKAVPIGATASATAFAYDPTDRTITLPTGFVGSHVFVKYDATAKNAMRISNQSDKFSTSGHMIARVLAKDPCDENKIYLGQIIYPKAKVSGNFSLSFGSEVAVHNVEIESLAFGCGGHNTLWDWYIFSEEGLEKVV